MRGSIGPPSSKEGRRVVSRKKLVTRKMDLQQDEARDALSSLVGEETEVARR